MTTRFSKQVLTVFALITAFATTAFAASEAKYRIDSLDGPLNACVVDLTGNSNVGGNVGDVLIVSASENGISIAGTGDFPAVADFAVGHQELTPGAGADSVKIDGDYLSDRSLRILETDTETASSDLVTLFLTDKKMSIVSSFSAGATEICTLSLVQ